MRQNWKSDYQRYRGFFLNIWAVYNTKPNFKIYLELILSITTIALFTVFAIKPTLLTIIELNKEISAKEITLNKLNKKIKNLQDSSRELERHSTNLVYIKQAIPESGNPDVLVYQFENLANLTNLKILGISVSDAVIRGSIPPRKANDNQKIAAKSNELPFSISVSGSYDDIFNFLATLENLRWPIKPDTLAINTSISDNQKRIVLVISGRVPYLDN